MHHWLRGDGCPCLIGTGNLLVIVQFYKNFNWNKLIVRCIVSSGGFCDKCFAYLEIACVPTN